MPLAVLSFDLGLLLEIFFVILVGMIFGLVLISLNLQRSIEIILCEILLFYEKRSMKIMIGKNLSAHRESNRLTSIIYSLTLGCIIFIVVSATLEVEILRTYPWGQITWVATYDGTMRYMGNGGIDGYHPMRADTVDPVIKRYSDYIDSFAYTCYGGHYNNLYDNGFSNANWISSQE